MPCRELLAPVASGASPPRRPDLGGSKCSPSSPSSTCSCSATAARPWPSMQLCSLSSPSASSSRSRLLSGAISGALDTVTGRDLDPVPPRALRPASSSARRERRRIGASPAFRGGHTPGMPGELHLTYLNRPDVEALALTDDEILGAVESRPARPGPGRDGDRAARAPAARRGVSRPLQRAARLHRAARRWRASRWSATTSTTTSSDCPPRTAC